MHAIMPLAGLTLALAMATGCQSRSVQKSSPASAAAAVDPSASPTITAPSALRGTVNAREHAPIPEQATVFVRLADVSRADGPLAVLGEQVIRSPRGWPIAFAVPYDPAMMDPSHRYEVQVRIDVEGKLHWINTTATPALQDAGKPVEVWVEQISTR